MRDEANGPSTSVEEFVADNAGVYIEATRMSLPWPIRWMATVLGPILARVAIEVTISLVAPGLRPLVSAILRGFRTTLSDEALEDLEAARDVLSSRPTHPSAIAAIAALRPDLLATEAADDAPIFLAVPTIPTAVQDFATTPPMASRGVIPLSEPPSTQPPRPDFPVE